MCHSLRTLYLNGVDKVRRKVRELPDGSHIKDAMDDERLDEIRASILDTPGSELEGIRWPQIYGFIKGRGMPDIEELDTDIDLVHARTPSKHQKGVVSFLRSRQWREWYAATFEIFVKSRCLRVFPGDVELDYELDNGKDVDLRVGIDGSPVCLECSALTDSDSDRKASDAYWEARAAGYKGNHVRPGPHDQSDGRGLDDAYEVVRIYAKVYDKMAPGFDVDKGQLSAEYPNVYLLSWGGRSDGLPAELHFDLAIPWAFDEMFTRGLPRHDPSLDGQFETSLRHWFHKRAETLAEGGLLDLDAYNADWHGYTERLSRVRRKLGGGVLFENLKLRQGRIHYNADARWAVSHRQMASLLDALSDPPPWAQ